MPARNGSARGNARGRVANALRFGSTRETPASALRPCALGSRAAWPAARAARRAPAPRRTCRRRRGARGSPRPAAARSRRRRCCARCASHRPAAAPTAAARRAAGVRRRSPPGTSCRSGRAARFRGRRVCAATGESRRGRRTHGIGASRNGSIAYAEMALAIRPLSAARCASIPIRPKARHDRSSICAASRSRALACHRASRALATRSRRHAGARPKPPGCTRRAVSAVRLLARRMGRTRRQGQDGRPQPHRRAARRLRAAGKLVRQRRLYRNEPQRLRRRPQDAGTRRGSTTAAACCSSTASSPTAGWCCAAIRWTRGQEGAAADQWQPLPDGRVRQLWESSKDGGETWTVAFDGYYARR